MAVGKGSMARASKAATNTAAPKDTKAADTVKVEKAVSGETAKKTTAAKVKKTTTKKAVDKAMAKETSVAASAVIGGTSKEVLKAIEYQKSSQVLDREPEKNETFGVGEAMPIYFF